MTVLIIAIVVNSIVFALIARTRGHRPEPPVKRQAVGTTTSPKVVEIATSRHVALHS